MLHAAIYDLVWGTVTLYSRAAHTLVIDSAVSELRIVITNKYYSVICYAYSVLNKKATIFLPVFREYIKLVYLLGLAECRNILSIAFALSVANLY